MTNLIMTAPEVEKDMRVQGDPHLRTWRFNRTLKVLSIKYWRRLEGLRNKFTFLNITANAIYATNFQNNNNWNTHQMERHIIVIYISYVTDIKRCSHTWKCKRVWMLRVQIQLLHANRFSPSQRMIWLISQKSHMENPMWDFCPY